MVVHLLLPAIHTVNPFMYVYTECHTYAEFSCLLTCTRLLRVLPVSKMFYSHKYVEFNLLV